MKRGSAGALERGRGKAVIPSAARNLLLVAAAVILAACSGASGKDVARDSAKPTNAAFRPVQVGDSAPRYEAATLSGDSVRFGAGEQAGAVTLVNVWATWCESCREEFADLEQIKRDFAAKGVKVVAVSVDQSSSAGVQRWVAAQKTTFPVIHDRDGRIQKVYSSVGVPSTYLVGRDGKIAWQLTGSLHANPEELRHQIEKTLAP